MFIVACGAGGDRIEYQDEGEQRGDFAGCTDDCAILAGTCTTAAMPAGTYTIHHGTDTLTMTIPSTTQLPCVGQTD